MSAIPASDIQKKILYGGKPPVLSFPTGSKATFHFKTMVSAMRPDDPDGEKDLRELLNPFIKSAPKETSTQGQKQPDPDIESNLEEDLVVIDDSKHYGKSMELIFGKQFQISVWETCLRTMLLGERARYRVPESQCFEYAFGMKKLREVYFNVPSACCPEGQHGHDHEHHHHGGCGLAAFNEMGGLGYPDLDSLLRKPRPLYFIFELVSYQEPEEHKQDLWIMNAEEKQRSIPRLREEGNTFYGRGELERAADSYSRAIQLLEELQLREKPGDVEWTELFEQSVPLRLNLAQCHLQTRDYYAAIKQTSEVLDKRPANLKALYRRSKAYTEVGDFNEAQADLTALERAAGSDAQLLDYVRGARERICKLEEAKTQADRSLFRNMFGSDAHSSSS